MVESLAIKYSFYILVAVADQEASKVTLIFGKRRKNKFMNKDLAIQFVFSYKQFSYKQVLRK